MKKYLLPIPCMLLAASAYGQAASQSYAPTQGASNSLFFSTTATGKKLPILWGLDTAWPSEGNIVRAVRFIGGENIGVCRVSFQPWDFLANSTTLTAKLENNLIERLRLASLINGVGGVQLVLNNDGGDSQFEKKYYGAGTNAEACRAYCNLIYATTLSCQNKGWEVITASPLNEPDYEWNDQGSKEDFLAIAKMLKTEYPQYKDGKIRISGGNTLNCDQALPWYTYLYDYIDEGNTHQLAGDFRHYAEFFTRVEADGKYPTADELHNVMEAMVGVEYGMKTGIWWGSADLARGEFCKASFGERLAYAENRKEWTAASVYRAPDGKIQGFIGSSERQALPSSYRFVSTDRDVYFNGHGPQREFIMETPGGQGYQDGQTNAEGLVNITWGEDVAPVVDGTYVIMNKGSRKLLSIKGTPANLSAPVQGSDNGNFTVKWEVHPAPITIGGDYSYHILTLTEYPNLKLDVNNWSLDEKGGLIMYDGGMGDNEQWYLEYAGNGYFRIISRHSNMCVTLGKDGTSNNIWTQQESRQDTPRQLWRFLPIDAALETNAPLPPASLQATPQPASVALQWQPSASEDTEGYNVYRADASGEYNTIARTVKGMTFVDNTASPGINYTYKIKAIDRSLNTSDATAAVAASTSGEKTLVAHYTFNQTIEDQTANRFDASIYAEATTKYVEGRTPDASCMRFAKDRFVQLPYQTFNSKEITIGMWINPSSRASTQTLVNFGYDYDHYIGFDILPKNILSVYAYDGEDYESVDGGTLVANEWQHIAVSITAERTALYINGALVGEGPTPLGLAPSDINPVLCYFGRDQEATTELTASIQDLCVYNYEVPADKIADVMGIDINAITSPMADSQIVSTEYFNMQGVRILRPTKGVYIVRNCHADGSVSIQKTR